MRGWTEASSRDEQIIFGPSLTDDSVLLRPTVAQKLEAGSPVKSATGIDMTLLNIGIPQSGSTRAWCQTRFLRWRRVQYRSGALAALSFLTFSPTTTITVRLPPPSSAPSFLPPPPHRRLQPPPLYKTDVRCCMWFTNTPSVSCCLGRACSSRCLLICVACQMPHPDMAG